LARSGLDGKAAAALVALDEQMNHHQRFCDEVERGWRAYKGVMEARSEAAQWTHKITPPYAEHIVEMTIAAMLDERLRFKVKPRPRMYNQGEYALRAKGAKAHMVLLDWQMRNDRFDEKQRPLVLQERIAGLSPLKVYWRTSTRMKRRLRWGSQDVVDPETGMPLGAVPTVAQVEEPDVLYDGPCVEVVNVQDFLYDHSAVSLDRCSIVAHRTWPTFEELKRLQQSYPGVYRNVDQLKESRDFGADGRTGPEGEHDRTRGRIEVWEIYRREQGGMRVYTIGNRNVLLAERDNPYWHGEFPFVVFSAQQEPFKVRGRAQIERIREIQEAIWSFGNLRLDATLLATMPIVMFSADYEDPDAFKFEPWARNVVDHAEQVKMWAPDAQVAQNSLAAESILKQDQQNLAGGFPFTSTSEARGVGADTATEASLVASIAQRSIVSAKTTLYQAYERVGQMMLDLNQQYLREPVYVDVVGLDEREEQLLILPQLLEGDFAFTIEPMTESLMRQERRAEATTLFTTVMQAAPVLAAMGAPPNARALLENLLESFDLEDTERFLAQPQPQAAAQAGAAPGMGSPPGMPSFAAQPGVTNGQLAAGPLSPSNDMSVSPVAAMQQFTASAGAGRSA